MNAPERHAIEDIAGWIEASLDDLRLSDEERRELIHLLRETAPPEEGLRQLRNRAFDLVRARLDDGGHASLFKWLEGIVRAIDTGRQPTGVVQSRAYFSPGEACLRAIVGQLRSARRSADVCVFTISDDRITAEILAAHRRGVAVRVITDNDKVHDAGSDIGEIQRAGIPVRVDRSAAHMHHKFALLDQAWLINGSYNWTRSACQVNEENLVVSNDPALMSDFMAEFETLWAQLGGRP